MECVIRASFDRTVRSVQGHVRTQLLDDALAITAERLDAAGERRVAALVRAASARPTPPS